MKRKALVTGFITIITMASLLTGCGSKDEAASEENKKKTAEEVIGEAQEYFSTLSEADDYSVDFDLAIGIATVDGEEKQDTALDLSAVFAHLEKDKVYSKIDFSVEDKLNDTEEANKSNIELYVSGDKYYAKNDDTEWTEVDKEEGYVIGDMTIDMSWLTDINSETGESEFDSKLLMDKFAPKFKLDTTDDSYVISADITLDELVTIIDEVVSTEDTDVQMSVADMVELFINDSSKVTINASAVFDDENCALKEISVDIGDIEINTDLFTSVASGDTSLALNDTKFTISFDYDTYTVDGLPE